KNEALSEDSVKQPTDNRSGTSDTTTVSSSLDDTKSNSQPIESQAKSDVNSVDEEKPSSNDLAQDRKDRELFEKYLRGDLADSKEKENNSPVAVDDEAKTTANTPVTIAILGNDKDSEKDKLEIVGISPPKTGKLETNDDGSITYSPEKDWAGKEVFSYTVGDGNGGIATASVQVEVEPAINHEPRAIADTISGNENTPEKIELKAEDPDDGDKLAFKIVEQPSHGKIADFKGSEGILVYLPDKDYQGKDGFEFIVTDGKSESKKGEIVIEVKPGKEPDKVQAQPDKEEQKPQDDQKQDDNKSKEKQGGSSGSDSDKENNNGDNSGETDKKQEEPKSEENSNEDKAEQKQDEPKAEQSGDGGNDN
ncbi:MAG TPA: Ig-like domain-containing protein, partial [Nitrososphaera sp.]